MGRRADRIAVLMIHGMGEQRPMETLRGFVEAAWTHDDALFGPGQRRDTYSKPDDLSGSLELRRITTHGAAGLGGRRCDFYEYYWAHHMTGNRLWSVLGWLRRLLFRKPETVPERLYGHWRLARGVIRVAAVLAALTGMAAAGAAIILLSGALILGPAWAQTAFFVLLAWLVLAGLVGALIVLAMPTFTSFVGDAARYFSPLPDNIAARTAIREGGLAAIERLHELGYPRVVVTAHSLGTAVGYDILNHAWGRIGAEAMEERHRDPPTAAALKALETAANALREAGEAEMPARRRAYREAQRAYQTLLAQPRKGAAVWRVSDFVTFGSPLGKADVLIAYDSAAWEELLARREAASSPPRPDAENAAAFSYRRGLLMPPIPHHAAAFGPTVWTNVYFANPGIVWGDLVGGAAAEVMGKGVIDVEVASAKWEFRHVDYWQAPAVPSAWIKALRAALNLRGLDEKALWQGRDGAKVVRAETLP